MKSLGLIRYLGIRAAHRGRKKSIREVVVLRATHTLFRRPKKPRDFWRENTEARILLSRAGRASRWLPSSLTTGPKQGKAVQIG